MVMDVDNVGFYLFFKVDYFDECVVDVSMFVVMDIFLLFLD